MIKRQHVSLPPGVVKRMERVIFQELPNMDGASPVEVVEMIYKTADFYYKHAVASQAVCKKGCSWCCRVPVDVSAIEVQYIHDKTGIKYAALERGKNWFRKPDKTKCPFLKNDCCSIYEARPFNCRLFATVDDPMYCVDGNTEHNIYSYESNQGMMMLRKFLDDVSEQNYTMAPLGDIREWFGHGKINAAEA